MLDITYTAHKIFAIIMTRNDAQVIALLLDSYANSRHLRNLKR